MLKPLPQVHLSPMRNTAETADVPITQFKDMRPNEAVPYNPKTQRFSSVMKVKIYVTVLPVTKQNKLSCFFLSYNFAGMRQTTNIVISNTPCKLIPQVVC